MKKLGTGPGKKQRSGSSQAATGHHLPVGNKLSSADGKTTTTYVVTEDAAVVVKRTVALAVGRIGHLRARLAEITKKKGYRRYGLHSQASRFPARAGRRGASYKVFKSAAADVSAAQIAADTEAVKTMLRRLVRPEAVEGWLNRTIPLLGRRTPAEAIRRGEAGKVIEVLARVEEGIHL